MNTFHRTTVAPSPDDLTNLSQHLHTSQTPLECSERRKKLAILFGGCSTEYSVSLQSAYSVITHIDSSAYACIWIGLHPHTGQWFWYRGDPERILNDSWFSEDFCIPIFPSTDQSIHGFHYMDNGILQTVSLDAALPILHGKN